MGVCCRIQLCCPPAKAAAELADFLNTASVTARRILSEFALVPLAIAATPSAPQPQAGQEMLERLHVHLRNELRQILVALGHEVEEGG